MRLLTFSRRGQKTKRIGAVGVGGVVDLTPAYAAFVDTQGETKAYEFAAVRIPHEMIEFIEGGAGSLEAAKLAIEYVKESSHQRGIESESLLLSEEEITFRPPVLRPGKIICAGMNYKEHLADSGRGAPERPVAFSQFPSTLIGHNGELLSTAMSQALDYEIELAVVIGKKGKYIPINEAQDYIYGYTIFNDVSDRNIQVVEMKNGLLLGAKNMDTFGPIGPYLVTKDEIENPHNLNIVLKVNGGVRQKSNTKYMIYNVFEQIAYWSSLMTLYPGDIFSTGTPAGVAMGRKPSPEPYYLKPGDVVEAEIDGLGVLVTRVIKEEYKKLLQNSLLNLFSQDELFIVQIFIQR